jgi:hypothetical protein
VLEPEAVAEDDTDDVDEVVVVVDMVVMSMKPAVVGVSSSVTVILELRCNSQSQAPSAWTETGVTYHLWIIRLRTGEFRQLLRRVL